MAKPKKNIEENLGFHTKKKKMLFFGAGSSNFIESIMLNHGVRRCRSHLGTIGHLIKPAASEDSATSKKKSTKKTTRAWPCDPKKGIAGFDPQPQSKQVSLTSSLSHTPSSPEGKNTPHKVKTHTKSTSKRLLSGASSIYLL